MFGSAEPQNRVIVRRLLLPTTYTFGTLPHIERHTKGKNPHFQICNPMFISEDLVPEQKYK